MSDLEKTLEQRSVYGSFPDQCETIHDIMVVVSKSYAWENDKLTEVDLEVFHMIAHKISRILHGSDDPNKRAEHWHDIAGYATLAERNCE